MKTISNVCRCCGKSNIADDCYDEQSKTCYKCLFEEKALSFTFKPEELKKEQFDSSEVYRYKLENLGTVVVGDILLDEYDVDAKYFNITINLNPTILSNIPSSNQYDQSKWLLTLPPEQAKLLYAKGERHPLLGCFRLVNKEPILTNFQSAGKLLHIKTPDSPMTWTDPDTNLMWEVKTIKDVKSYTFDEAREYAKELNAQNYGGYNDWRIPSTKELESLLRCFYGKDNSSYSSQGWSERHMHLHVNFSFIKLALTYNGIFIGFNFYWTCEKDKKNNSHAFIVDFCTGVTQFNIFDHSSVRCVRGRL